MGGPEMAPHTPPAFVVPRRSRGTPQHPGTPSRPFLTFSFYSRIVSNWNLQPMGVSAFTTLKPDMVS
jgi:hypothetical protein